MRPETTENRPAKKQRTESVQKDVISMIRSNGDNYDDMNSFILNNIEPIINNIEINSDEILREVRLFYMEIYASAIKADKPNRFKALTKNYLDDILKVSAIKGVASVIVSNAENDQHLNFLFENLEFDDLFREDQFKKNLLITYLHNSTRSNLRILDLLSNSVNVDDIHLKYGNNEDFDIINAYGSVLIKNRLEELNFLLNVGSNSKSAFKVAENENNILHIIFKDIELRDQNLITSEVIKILKENGLDLNHKNSRGETPLFLASGVIDEDDPLSDHKLNILRTLIEHGADPTITRDGEGPLHQIDYSLFIDDENPIDEDEVKNSTLEAIKLLGSEGADTSPVFDHINRDIDSIFEMMGEIAEDSERQEISDNIRSTCHTAYFEMISEIYGIQPPINGFPDYSPDLAKECYYFEIFSKPEITSENYKEYAEKIREIIKNTSERMPRYNHLELEELRELENLFEELKGSFNTTIEFADAAKEAKKCYEKRIENETEIKGKTAGILLNKALENSHSISVDLGRYIGEYLGDDITFHSINQEQQKEVPGLLKKYLSQLESNQTDVTQRFSLSFLDGMKKRASSTTLDTPSSTLSATEATRTVSKTTLSTTL